MGSAMSLKLIGADELKAAFEEISKGAERRVLRRATTVAMGEQVKAAKARAPFGEGLLKKSIGINVKTYRNSGVVVATVGPLWNVSRPDNDRHGNVKTRTVTRKSRNGKALPPVTYNREIKPAFYGVPVEFGHVTKGGRFVPPRAFMRGSFTATAPFVLMKWEDAMMAGLLKEVAKVGGKG
jgi:hypothetical protein